jgi:hypothetical protein
MRLRGRPSKAPILAVLLLLVIVILAAAVYVAYLAPR